MKYIRTKYGVYEFQRYYEQNDYYWVKGLSEPISKKEILNQSNNLDELCDCFIIKYVESNHFALFDAEDYSGARWVYYHDKQNTTCILYGVIENQDETALNYVAIENGDKGLVLL